MIEKQGKEGDTSKKLITNNCVNTINHSNGNFTFESINKKRSYELGAKHQILGSVEDIQHFMQPYLPLSNSINPSCSTDAYINDAKYDRFIRDKPAFYMRELKDISAISNIIHSKYCYCKINTVSITSAVITGASLLLFMIYIIVNHISTSYNTSNSTL